MNDEQEQEFNTLQRESDELHEYMSDGEIELREIDPTEEYNFGHTFANCIMVDNLPAVPKVKHDKLLGVVQRVFTQLGKIIDIEMPLADDNLTTGGFAFIEYATTEEAKAAVAGFNEFVLDKRHTLSVNHYTDLNKFMTTPNEYTEPEQEDFVTQPDLKAWLADERGRDMFALRYGRETEIHWVEHGMPTLHYDGELEKTNGKQWCSQYVMWSPQGTYLATFHPQGIALWGSDTFEKMGRFAHKSVKIALFSPKENYLITVSEIEGDNGIIVWDTRSGNLLRAFPSSGGSNGVQGVVTPFRWSFDDKYVYIL